MVRPLDVLEESLNAQMVLLLKDGRRLKGTLVGYDQYMNLVLEETTETKGDEKRQLGTIVLRGNNVVSMARP